MVWKGENLPTFSIQTFQPFLSHHKMCISSWYLAHNGDKLFLGTGSWMCILIKTVKVRTLWEGHKIWTKSLSCFDFYWANQLICQNKREFFSNLCCLFRIAELYQMAALNGKQYFFCNSWSKSYWRISKIFAVCLIYIYSTEVFNKY